MNVRLQFGLAAACLLLALILAAGGAGTVGATSSPTFIMPQSAHMQFDATMRANDRESASRLLLTVSGQGDYDRARRAAQFAAELAVEGVESGVPQAERQSFAVVMVDGKTFWQDPATGAWTWMHNTPEMEAQLDRSLDPSALAGLDGLTFVALRKEVLGGATTTHWRAEVDFAALLAAQGVAPPSDPATPLPQLTMAFDLWIGDDDGYLHRADLTMAMLIADASGPISELTASYALTFSKFDQPATIVAPVGAAPTATDPAALSPLDLFAGALPSNVSSSLGVLVPDGSGGALPGTGRNGGARISVGVEQPSASARPVGAAPAATATPRPTPTAAPPKPTVARAANVVTTGEGASSAPPAPGALQAAPGATAGARGGNSALFLAGIATLLVLALGLTLAGLKIGRRA